MFAKKYYINLINMTNLYVLGDLHFSSRYAWSNKLQTTFLDWFEQCFSAKQNEEKSLIQLGDITDANILDGLTIRDIYRFAEFVSKNFKDVYILTGNHCYKYYKNQLSYSGEFLKSYPNIHIISEPEILNIDGYNVLQLPYARYDDNRNLDKFYAEGLPSEFYKFENGLICGHVAILDENAKYGGMDISKFNMNNAFAFGHVHNRIGPFKKMYTGSAFPNAINEEGQRVIKVFNLNGSGAVVEKTPIEIPQFVKYDEVTYPTPIPQNTDNIIHVYTVKNCKLLIEAQMFYKDNYIKDTQYSSQLINNNSATTASQFQIRSQKSAIDMFQDMVKQQCITLKRSEMAYIKNKLKDI